MENGGLPGLVNVYKKLWKDPPFSSWVNRNYFDWAIFKSYVKFSWVIISNPGLWHLAL